MLKNYLKIALRNLVKSPLYSLLNIAGLAIGLICFILIALYVRYEFSYDQFHENADQIFRVAGSYQQGDKGRTESAATTYLLAPMLQTDFPEIEEIVRVNDFGALVHYEDEVYQEEHLISADSNFFELFSFPLIKGEPTTVLEAPNSAVISESLAKKYFGDANPIGKVLEIFDAKIEVTGLMKDFPGNSHFHADMVIADAVRRPSYPAWVFNNSSGTSHLTYILLPKGIQSEQVQSQLSSFVERHFNTNYLPKFFLQPITSIHTSSNLTAEMGVNTNHTYLYIFSLVGLFTLLIACINYINLATARATNRAKEVGVRKAVGASRLQVSSQFIVEAVVVALIGLGIALLFAELALPYFIQLAGTNFAESILGNSTTILVLILLALVVGFLSGGYPAFILSKMRSVLVLKSGQFGKSGKSSNALRKGLVVLQFTISIGLLAATLLVYKQLNFMREKDLGISTEQIVNIPITSNAIQAQYDSFKEELLKNANILHVTASNSAITNRVGGWRDYQLEGLEENQLISTMVVDYDFFETIGADMVAGRSFSRDFKTDDNEAYILNEAAVKKFELESPVGKKIVGAIFTGSEWNRKNARIIGVAKDFHLASLHSEIQPLVFSLRTPQTTSINWIAVKLTGNNLEGTLNYIKESWKNIEPVNPFEFAFMDNTIQEMYIAEKKFGTIFTLFTALAIFIACMGIFGLASYSVRQRTKEIGLRKILGASISQISFMLSASFIKPLLISFVLAIPLVWMGMSRWLENFAYRTSISAEVFVIAAVLIIVLALISVSIQSLRAALANPVEALKYE